VLREIGAGRRPGHAFGHESTCPGTATFWRGPWSGSHERIAAIRPILVDVGGALAPLAAFLVLRGLPTLAIRMERHTETALDLAAWLAGQDGVERVPLPGPPGRPEPLVRFGSFHVFGGMLAFELTGGREAGRAFLDAMVVAERTASLGAFERSRRRRPPPLTASWTRPRCGRRASLPGCSAAPSGSRTWRICAPTWRWVWPRRARPPDPRPGAEPDRGGAHSPAGPWCPRPAATLWPGRRV